MAELKTKLNDASVEKFLDTLKDEKRRKECYAILELMKRVTKQEPKMWGSSMVGFGSYHYKYESGREGDWFLTGFSPRKQNLTIYSMSGFAKQEKLMKELGKFKSTGSCLYINKIEDIDLKVLKELITNSVEWLKSKNS